MVRDVHAFFQGGTNAGELNRMKESLRRALNEDITEKQRRYLMHYYGDGMSMEQIGARYGVDKSTISRTIKRGEGRLRRCLRYGAGRLLRGEEG